MRPQRGSARLIRLHAESGDFAWVGALSGGVGSELNEIDSLV